MPFKPPRGKDVAFALTWQDDETPSLGEGISRTSDKNAPMWAVTIQIPGQMPIKEVIRAHTRKEAKLFATNRYPKASSIIVTGKAS